MGSNFFPEQLKADNKRKSPTLFSPSVYITKILLTLRSSNPEIKCELATVGEMTYNPPKIVCVSESITTSCISKDDVFNLDVPLTNDSEFSKASTYVSVYQTLMFNLNNFGIFQCNYRMIIGLFLPLFNYALTKPITTWHDDQEAVTHIFNESQSQS